MELISSLCRLISRGALISMLVILLVLPALLILCDGIICRTTKGMTHLSRNQNQEVSL